MNKKKNNHTFFKSLKKLFNYSNGFKSILIIIIILSVFVALISVATPYLLGLITTSIFDSVTNSSPIRYNYIILIIIILICLYLTYSFTQYVKNVLAAKLGQDLSYSLRNDLIEKIEKLEIKSIEKYKKGDLLSRITNDIEKVSSFYSDSFQELVYHLVYMISVIIMMLYINVTLSLIAFIIVPVIFIILGIIIRRSQKYFDLNQKTLGEVNSIVEETITNNGVIKSFNKENYFNKKFDNINSDLMEYNYKSSLYSGIAMPIINFANNLNYAVIIGIGGYFAIKGYIKVGEIQAFAKYMNEFSRPLAMLGQILGYLEGTASATNRIFEVLESKEEKVGKVTSISTPNKIIFDNVSFSYNEKNEVLKNISFEIEKGKQTAIVGKTGCGKTTIISLIMGLYKVNNGKILFDNTNINDINKQVLRDKVSMVLQDTWIFNDILKNNITLYDKTKKEDLIKVLDESYLTHIINSLPGGIDFKINEEANNISEGEKQLVTIARALLKNSDILILDEATSNVDSRIEYVIHKSMKNLMKDRTSIVIAHRLSTIVNSDKIIVVDDGKIVEEGTHKDLLKKHGYYYKLYNSGNLDE